MAKFIKEVPVVHERIIDECGDMVKSLKDQGLLVAISIEDVYKELNSRILEHDELIQLMKWWIEYSKRGDIYHSQNELYNFKNLTRINWKDNAPKENGGDQRMIQSTLAHIKYFVNPKTVPPDMSFPDDVLPHSISKEFWKSDLETYFG